MSVRFFVAGGEGPVPHSVVPIAVPREGEAYVSLRSGYPAFYFVHKVVHVGGQFPIVMPIVDEDRPSRDIVVAVTHPAEDAWA